MLVTRKLCLVGKRVGPEIYNIGVKKEQIETDDLKCIIPDIWKADEEVHKMRSGIQRRL